MIPAEKRFTQGGDYVRAEDAFRDWVTHDGRSGFPAEAGRYHLYVSHSCPWAHRTVIARTLMGLEDAIGMTAVNPVRDDRGWKFGDGPDCSGDPINGFHFLSELYAKSHPGYSGRATVPVLWDKRTGTIVSNADDDIMRMFEAEFGRLAKSDADLYPMRFRSEIDELNDLINETVNDGVYRAHFAKTQAAYERAARGVFKTLDLLENRLAARPYLVAEVPVETDWRLFVTLVRFDSVYYMYAKCNLKRIADYEHLPRYLRELYHIPGIAATVDFDQIRRHYFRIVPIGPLLDLAPNPKTTRL